MTEAAKKIFDDVLMLSNEERLELVETLYGEFGPPDADYEKEWADEIKRRLDDLDSGKTKPIPWEEVQKKLGFGPSEL